MCGGGGGGGGPTEDQLEDSRRQERIARERQQAIVSQQMNEAGQFRAELPDMEKQMHDQLTDTSRRGLSQSLYSNRVDAGRRGLINSRLKESNEGALRGQAATNLAGARGDVSMRLNKQADDMDRMASQGALNDYAQRQQIEDNIFARALERVSTRQAVYGQAGAAIGKGIGAAAGSGGGG